MNEVKYPLADITVLVGLADKILVDMHYARSTFGTYRHIWNFLKFYMSVKGTSMFSLEMGKQFLLDDYGIDANQFPQKSIANSTRVRAIRFLENILSGEALPKKNSGGVKNFSTWIEPLISAFMKSILANYTKVSIYTMRNHLLNFDLYLKKNNITSFSQISYLHVQSSILSLSNRSKKTVNSAVWILRKFLQYLYENGQISTDFSAACPKARIGHNESIPTTFSQKELQRFIGAIDRGSPIGKRDYAMFLLAIRLGLRVGEITGLKFEHLKWETNRIEFVQSKTNRLLSLPLMDEVGWAIIEYIKDARPKFAKSDFVFVHQQAPYSRMMSMYEMLSKYIQISRIDLSNKERHGMHVFRHTLASTLLQQDVSIPVISEILNHANTEVTNIYLKVDSKRLAKCALEVNL